ncbi:L-threonylcarbamoyladenylate synthase [Sphingorhabdus pulchriflava]|nr:L-threonylcarbamoyladenylate synthase [Sphingorhabdus pulchriflava]
MMTGSNPLGHGRIIKADAAAISEAAAALQAGDVVAIPTETVYGLAADASNAAAVANIYRTKGRPDFNPLIVHVPDHAAAERLAQFDERAALLAFRFWPGPLTLVLPLQPDAPVAKAVTAGLPTIALRCPAHPVMQAVLKQSRLFLAAPSANRSGGISPTRAEHVARSFGDAMPLVLDAGSCSAGLESTIVAVRENGWQLLRPGPVTMAEISELLGEPPLPVTEAKIEAPGQLASHYAPSKPVRLNVTKPAPGEWHIGFGDTTGDDNLSAEGDLAEAAARLFDALHIADASDRASIAIAPIPDDGIGVAINDRLRRAAA